MAVLFAESLRHDAIAVGVATLPRMIARGKVVDIVGRGILLHLDLAAMDRPEAELLLLLPRRSRLSLVVIQRQIRRFLLAESVHLDDDKTNFINSPPPSN